MADPQVQAILPTTIGSRSPYRPRGPTLKCNCRPPLKAQGIDCLWPSSASAQRVFESQHQTADFSGYRTETLLQSPEVIYSGPESTAALMRQGIVDQRANRYYIVDMKRLLLDLVLKHRTWRSLEHRTSAAR